MNRYRDSLSVGDAARLSELLAVLLLAGFSSPSPPLSVSSSLSLSVSLSSSLGGWRIGRRRISRCVGWEERERERESGIAKLQVVPGFRDHSQGLSARAERSADATGRCCAWGVQGGGDSQTATLDSLSKKLSDDLRQVMSLCLSLCLCLCLSLFLSPSLCLSVCVCLSVCLTR